MNNITLIGRLGGDIEIRKFENGCIGNVSLATSEKYTKKNGDKIEDTEWHNLVFSNKSAEIIEKYTSKGSQIAIQGRLKYRKWNDKDGNNRISTEIRVKDFELLGSKNDTKPNQGQTQAPELQPEQDGDLPF